MSSKSTLTGLILSRQNLPKHQDFNKEAMEGRYKIGDWIYLKKRMKHLKNLIYH